MAHVADQNEYQVKASASVAPPGYDVIALLGQSNMVGFSGQAASASLDPAVQLVSQLKQDNTIVQATEFLDHPSTPTGVGPGFPFARQFIREGINRGRKVLLVPCAVVATPLVSTTPPTWNSTVSGSLLDNAITRINTALAAEPGSRLAAVLWIQGGADGTAGATQAQYASAIDALITKLRTTIVGPGASTVPFILSSDPLEAVGGTITQIRAAQIDTPNRNTRTYYVSPPTNMVVAGNVHFSNAGERALGQKLFDGFQAVRAGVYTDTTMLNTLSLASVVPPNMHQSGRHYVINSVFSANQVPTLNELRAYPFPVFTQLPLAGLYAQLVTAGSADSTCRLGIYADDGTGVPGALVMDLGSISTGTGNAGTVATGGVAGTYLVPVPSAISLAPGLYWAAAVCQGTTSATMVVTGTTTQPTSMWNTPLYGGTPTFTAAMGWRQVSVSGALPSSFASSGAVQTPIRMGYKVL